MSFTLANIGLRCTLVKVSKHKHVIVLHIVTHPHINESESEDVCVFCVCSNEDISREFDRLDKDKNGVLSPEEVSGVMRDMMQCDSVHHMSVEGLIKSFDTNEDGNLDKTEFMQMWSSMFGGGKK